MGQPQPTGCRTHAASPSRFPPRQCHRKGCDHTFVPRRWNQRYCREPECWQLLQRWQAAKRQQRRRARAEVRQQHAEAQRQRRQRRRAEAGVRPTERALPPSAAAAPRAWSRSKKNIHDFCDRPGCFEPRGPSRRAPARYCAGDCRPAVRRVQDRERKWKRRKHHVAAAARRSAHHLPRRERKHTAPHGGTNSAVTTTARPAQPIRRYRDATRRGVSSRETHPEVPTHDQETSAGRGSRAPPSA
jgi:hypothetical protein